MPDNNIVNQNTTPPIGTNSGQAPTTVSTVPNTSVADSPWNEPLPEEVPKPQVVAGTLAGNQPAVAPPTPTGPLQGGSPSGPAQPFALPQNVESSMPPVLKATDMTPGVNTQAAAQPVDSISTPSPAFSYNYDQNKPQTPTGPLRGGVSSGPVNADIKPAAGGVSSLIKPPVTGAPLQPVMATPTPQSTPVPAPLPASQPIQMQPPAPPPLPLGQEKSFVVPDAIAVASSSAVPENSVVSTPPNMVNGTTGTPPKKAGLSSLFARLKRKPPKGAPLGPKEQTQQTDSSVQPETDANPRSKSRMRIIIYSLLGIALILGLLIYATEAGLLSLGLEKAYGAVGLEKLWGGLPKNAETAMAESLVAMKDHQKFKVTGTITLNIDKTIKNTVTTPLVSDADSVTRLAVLPIKAILATESLPSLNDPSVVWIDDTAVTTPTDTGSSSTSGGTASTTTPADSTTPTSSSSTAASSTTPAASGSTTPANTDTVVPADTSSSTASQQSESAFADTTTTKTINTTISGSFGDSGNDIEIKIVKPIGSQTIDLKNAKNNLWVKSDQIKFSDKAVQGKWLLYNLASLGDKGVVSQTLSIDSGKGFSAVGTRQVNEKVGSARCYKYSLDSVELGNSLSGIGVSSDSIQNISGTVWIGVKDKLIRRLDLKITTSPSSPVIQINLSLNLSDYDSDNNFKEPALEGIIISPSGGAATAAPATSTTTTPASAATTGE